MILCQREYSIAKQPAHLALWCDEIRRSRRVQDVFVRRKLTLTRIRVEQAIRRFTPQNERQFPGQIVGILHA